MATIRARGRAALDRIGRRRRRLFSAAGHWLARTTPNGVVLYLGTIALVTLVTAMLNLDTSVAFLTPGARLHRLQPRQGQAPLLYGFLLISNAASLVLPGSNLTNLIVLGHLHLSGGRFLSPIWPAASAAIVVPLSMGAALGALTGAH